MILGRKKKAHENKCYSYEAKNFENKLEELGITYNQFLALWKQWDELTVGAKAEVDNILNKHRCFNISMQEAASDEGKSAEEQAETEEV